MESHCLVLVLVPFSTTDKQLETENMRPVIYKFSVDDPLSIISDDETTSEFLKTFNNSHPSFNLTMELKESGRQNQLIFIKINSCIHK